MMRAGFIESEMVAEIMSDDDEIGSSNAFGRDLSILDIKFIVDSDYNSYFTYQCS
jgi:hypothetical protein